MNCPECNTVLREDARFCPVCGTEVAPLAEVGEERSVIKSPSLERKKLRLILTVAICVLSACIAIFLGYVAIKTFSPEKKTTVCAGCSTAFEGSGMYCNECKNENSGTIKTEKNCRACRRSFVSENQLCDKCLSKAKSALYDGNYSCEICLETVSAEDIVWIDNYGYVYCMVCDTGKYCSGCNAMLDYDDDDNTCVECAVFVCNKCEEVLEQDEVAFQGKNEILCNDCYEPSGVCSVCGEKIWGGLSILRDENGNEYCRDCAPTTIKIRCVECGDFLEHGDDDLYCWECADISCCICREVLSEDEIGARDEYGDVFCKECCDS